MGAVLIGLGIIAFIAANWSEIPKLAKLAMMMVGTPAIYIIGWFVGYRFGYPRIGTAILLLGAIAFGASIHLVAQTYHVEVNHPTLVPMWFLGVIPLAYITRSRAILGLSIILLLAAAGFRAQEWVPEFGSEETTLLLPGLLPLGAFLFAAGRMQARFADTRRFARLCDISGLLTVAAGIYFLSFDELWYGIGRDSLSFSALTVEYWVVVAVSVVVIAAMIAVAAWRIAGRHPGQIWWEAGAVSAMALVAAAMWLGGWRSAASGCGGCSTW